MKQPYFIAPTAQLTVDGLIKSLMQLQADGYGNYPVYVVDDDEGNTAHAIGYSASVGYVPHDEWCTDRYEYDVEAYNKNPDDYDIVVIIG